MSEVVKCVRGKETCLTLHEQMLRYTHKFFETTARAPQCLSHVWCSTIGAILIGQ